LNKAIKNFDEYEFVELYIIELKQKYDYKIFEIRKKSELINF
jgi:hypothetical protein